MNIVDVILAGFFAPMILFFLVGMLSVAVKSDVEIPKEINTGLSLFLLMSIGLRGGMKAINGIQTEPRLMGIIVIVAIISAILGIVFAFFSGKVLIKFVKLKAADAWAVAGHYGAVSLVTLTVGVALASHWQDMYPEAPIFVGWIPAMYPFMDSPALVTAILMGRMAIAKENMVDKTQKTKVDIKKILHSSIFGVSVWILITSLIVGALARIFSPRELDKAMFLFDNMFRGVLSIFLLGMGISAAKRLNELKAYGKKTLIKVVIFAFFMPQIWAMVGILAIFGVHSAMPGLIGWGDALVFAAIAGGCSYISAPVAMRASLPEANPSVYLPMVLALTFPFNIIVGMPIWMSVCMNLWGFVP